MDRISSLPNDVILMIVRFLSAKEAARVSVLSKGFKNLFAIIPDLEFGIKQEKLRGFLERILALPEITTRIRKFTLKCEGHVDSENYAHLNSCIRHVLKLGVMDLELCICGENGYSLPLEVFTCKTVNKLKLGTGFVIDVIPKNALLPALETLILDSIRFSGLHDC
ncbi:unnamed protein product, partial [Arabidopsis halleri]